MADRNELTHAADLERRDLGNVPRDEPTTLPVADDTTASAETDESPAAEVEEALAPGREDSPETDPETEDLPEGDEPDAVQLREQLAQAQRELALAQAAQTAPPPAVPEAPPTFDASNILPVAINEQLVEGWGLPKEAAGQINDMLRIVALSAKNAAQTELRHEYATQQQQVQRNAQLRAKFYKDNQDLEQYADFVQTTAEAVKREYPTYTDDALLPVIAQTARQRLTVMGVKVGPKSRRRRRRPATSDTPGSTAGARPNGRAKSYTDQLGDAMDAFADGRR